MAQPKPIEEPKPPETPANLSKIEWKGQQYVLSKLAALEVYNVHKASRTLGFISIIGFLFTAFLRVVPGMIGTYIMAGVVSILSAGVIFFVWRDTSRMKYLQQTYSLGPKKPGGF